MNSTTGGWFCPVLAEQHFHFHSVVAGRLQDPPAGSNYGEKVKVPLRRVWGVCVCEGRVWCVCVKGGGIVFDLDSVRCEPRTHGIESHHLTEPEP